MFDEEKIENMKLISLYPWNGGTRFALLQMTEQEIENRELKNQLKAAELSIAELTIIMSSMMG